MKKLVNYFQDIYGNISSCNQYSNTYLKKYTNGLKKVKPRLILEKYLKILKQYFIESTNKSWKNKKKNPTIEYNIQYSSYISINPISISKYRKVRNLELFSNFSTFLDRISKNPPGPTCKISRFYPQTLRSSHVVQHFAGCDVFLLFTQYVFVLNLHSQIKDFSRS